MLKSIKKYLLKYDIYKGVKNIAFNDFNKIGYTIIRTNNDLENLLRKLYQYKDKIHSWDTETIDVDVKKESPVGKGKIISAQVFCGPEVDFGNGPRVFLDNFGECSDNIMYLKDYFENENIKKVWFNYGFDRHIFYNHGINCKGFGGDVMQMARLVNPSQGPKEYSLSAISKNYQKNIMNIKKMYLEQNFSNEEKKNIVFYFDNFKEDLIKTKMTKIFATKKVLKNGELGKTFEMPEIEQIHTSKDLIDKWVEYSCLDAELTYFLREVMVMELKSLNCDFENNKNLYDLYKNYWNLFGELLTEIERNGFFVDKLLLKESQKKAVIKWGEYRNKFLSWIYDTQENCREFNPSSINQLQQLLFAPFKRRKINDKNTNKKDILKEEEENDDPMKIVRNIKVINEFPEIREFKVLDLDENKESKLKYKMMKVKGMGLNPISFSWLGLPSVDTNALIKLISKDKDGLSPITKQIKNQKKANGLEIALQNLIEMRQTETLLRTFINPLLELGDSKGRIHCSLNLNTETGRLSSRKPNLQNLPALDKDKFLIRKCFRAEKGNKLIIADYGQLELRILAHMTNCKSMLESFKLGGDFHSRTALQMFDYIEKDLKEKKIILEGKKADVPSLKEKYPSERKKAKTMNFSIAYGKSAIGFAKDWNCSITEAQTYLNKWFESRPEVLEWQENVKKIAVEKGWTKTLAGRYRNLTKEFKSNNKFKILHGIRQAINTPIQGGAADLMIAAMCKVYQSKRLKKLNWKMIHQVHDEIIIEGPTENSEEALKILKNIMENPFEETKLLINLEVDAKICDNWYESK